MTSLKELAKLAGVDISTVSRALRDSPRVKTETKDLIKRLAEQYDYVPDDLARGLVGKRTYTIGVIVPEFINTFYAEIIEGIESVLSSEGYNLLFGKSGFDCKTELEYYRTFLRKRVDGIIGCTVSQAFLDQINRIRHDVPLVLADAYAANADFDNVTVDNSYGVLCIIEHLVKLGHGRIGFIGDRIVTQERLKSYQKALEHYHITPAEEYIRISQERYEHGGYLRMKELLSLPERPTAVFAVTDNMAIGAMRAAIEMGFSIPDDVSIVGFDDIMVSSYMEVPLTTMLQPKFDIGKLSADLLLGRINAKAGKFVQQVVLRPEMVIRQTTSRAKNTSDHPSPEPRRT